MITLREVLIAKYAQNQWAWSGDSDDYGSLLWHDEQACPTKKELTALKSVVETEREATAYKQLRASAYPSVVDQLDLLFHGGYDVWKEAIQAVKNEYPKP